MFNQNLIPMYNVKNQSNSNEINIEEIIKPFQEKIKKLEDEMREKDLEIAKLKFKLLQIDNTIKNNQQFMNNNMGQINTNNNIGKMNMNNNMGKINKNNNIGQINKNNNMRQMNMNNNMCQMNMNNNMCQMNMNNNMGQMNMNNNMGQMNMNNNMDQMNPLDNNMENQMNMNMIKNPLNMMNYQFNQNNMNILMDQMNNVGSQINVIKNEMGMENKNQNLSIKIRMENGTQILISCRPDFKMEKIIQCFFIKACIENIEDYDFFIIKEEKAKLDSNIEQNGINLQKDYILAKKNIKPKFK